MGDAQRFEVSELVVHGPDGVRPDPQAPSWMTAGRRATLALRGLHADVLARAGADYDLATVRAAVHALAAHGVDVTLRAPLADAQTTPDELIATLGEVAALALRFPGRLEFVAEVGARPQDAWVAAAVDAGVLDAERLYTLSLERLRTVWSARLDAAVDEPERRLGEFLVRRLDDAPRRAIFASLRRAWLRLADGWPGGAMGKEPAMALATSLLGDVEGWMKRFRQYTYDTTRRVVLIPTWQCELRCSYCYIPKQDGRVMTVEVAERGVDLALSTELTDVMIQFFGGEALLAWPVLQHAIDYAQTRARALGKTPSYVVSSNGWSLDEEKLSWMKERPIRLELSLDGDERTQNRFRPSRWKAAKSYDNSIATHASAILASGIEQYVIMVVHPTNVDAMPANFFHIADLGFKRIQINNMLGRVWTEAETASFARGLHQIGQGLIARWARGESIEFINMQHKPVAMRLNGEVTVDWDGTIYGGNSFLHETEHKDKFVLATLDDRTGVDRYWIDATDNHFLLDWSYRPTVTKNNVDVGKIMASFIGWMTKKGYRSDGPAAQAGATEASP